MAEKQTLYLARQTSANTHNKEIATKNHNPKSQSKSQSQNEYYTEIILTS